MTQEEILAYEVAQNKFQHECERVCKEMSRFDRDFHYLSSFELDVDLVFGEGEDTWAYGGHEYYSKTFSADLLKMSDNELKKHVDNLIREEEEEKLKREQLKLDRQKEMELKELARLKEKYNM